MRASVGGKSASGGVNGSIDLSNHDQFFEMTSKTGNSMKEVEQRIHNYIEDINGRKFAKKDSQESMATRIDERGMSTDYGMHEGKRQATALFKQRMKGRGGSFGAVQQQVAEMPMIKNNLYKLDAWVNPFADVNTLHH